MVVEATKMAGDGQLVLTGQLGDVMKESATIALNWIRSHAKQVRSKRGPWLSNSGWRTLLEGIGGRTFEPV